MCDVIAMVGGSCSSENSHRAVNSCLLDEQTSLDLQLVMGDTLDSTLRIKMK